jgi:nucleoid DNA-binding protein
MSKLTKSVLQKFLQKKYNISVEHSHFVVDVFFQTITKLSMEEGGVLLKNFGRFEFRKKILEKNIYNFQTKTSEVMSMNSERVHFVPSKILKEKVF